MPSWATPAATLLASFAGAAVAFGLQAWRLSRNAKRENVSAVNRAMMVLLLHGRVLANYKTAMLEDYSKSDPLRCVKVEASLQYDLARYRFDFESLDFFSDFDERDVVLKLYEEEDLFTGVLQAINDRSALLYNEVDPALLKSGLADGKEHEGLEYPKALGPALFGALERKTDAVAVSLDGAFEHLQQTLEAFSSTVHRRYPRAEVMYVQIEHTEGAH